MEEEICFPQERKQRKLRQFFCPQSHICMVSWQGSLSHCLYLAIHDLTDHSQLFYSESERKSEVMLLALLACRLVLRFGRLRHDAWPCISLQQESGARLSNQRLCLCLWCRAWGEQRRSMFSIKSPRWELFLGWIKDSVCHRAWTEEKMKVLSLFTHLLVVSDLFSFIYFVEHKKRRLADCPSCTFPSNENRWASRAVEKIINAVTFVYLGCYSMKMFLNSCGYQSLPLHGKEQLGHFAVKMAVIFEWRIFSKLIDCFKQCSKGLVVLNHSSLFFPLFLVTVWTFFCLPAHLGWFNNSFV